MVRESEGDGRLDKQGACFNAMHAAGRRIGHDMDLVVQARTRQAGTCEHATGGPTRLGEKIDVGQGGPFLVSVPNEGAPADGYGANGRPFWIALRESGRQAEGKQCEAGDIISTYQPHVRSPLSSVYVAQQELAGTTWPARVRRPC